jgi:hypothetical protein
MTVVCTIHQPSASTFYQFDKLLLLAAGKVCCKFTQSPKNKTILIPPSQLTPSHSFSLSLSLFTHTDNGPVNQEEPLNFLTGLGYPCPDRHNPADHIMEVLASKEGIIDELHAAQVKFQTQLTLKQATMTSALGGEVELPKLTAQPLPASVSKRIGILLQRNARILIREPGLARARVGSHIMMGLIMGILYRNLGDDANAVQERIALILFSMIFLMLAPALPTILNVHPELAIIRKEFRNNWYDLRSYYIAKVATDTPLLIIPCFLYLSIMGQLTGLADFMSWRFGMMYVALLALTLVVHAWALFLTCAAPSFPIAIFMAPISLLPCILFAGFFKNIEDITWAFRWFSYVDFANYSWKAMTFAGFMDLEMDGGLSGDMVLEDRLSFEDPKESDFWKAIGITMCFMTLFRFMAYFALVNKFKN